MTKTIPMKIEELTVVGNRKLGQKMICIPKKSNINFGDKVRVLKIIEEGDKR